MKLSRLRYFLFPLFLSNQIFAESTSTASDRFQAWVSKFGDASAIDAVLKNRPKTEALRMREWVDDLLRGNGQVVNMLDRQTGLSKPIKIEDVRPSDERDFKMINNIQTTIDESIDGDLVIVFVGEAHALDYFYRKARGLKEGVYYIGLKLTPDRPKFSPELIRLFQLLKDLRRVSEFNNFSFDEEKYLKASQSSMATNGGEVGLRLGTALYEGGTAISESERGQYLSGLKKRSSEFSKPKVIFFCDLHEEATIAHILQMVGSETLKAMGYKRIIVSFEGYNPDQELRSISSLIQEEYWTDFAINFENFFSQALEDFDYQLNISTLNDGQKQNLFVYRERIVQSLIDIREGRITNHPAALALLIKLREIERASDGAISVKVIGNDARIKGDPTLVYYDTNVLRAADKPEVPWGWPKFSLHAK